MSKLRLKSKRTYSQNKESIGGKEEEKWFCFHLISTGEKPTKSIPDYFEFVIFGEVSVDVSLCFLSCLTFLSICIQEILLKNLSLKLYFAILYTSYLFSTSNLNSQKTVKQSRKTNPKVFLRRKSKPLEQKDGGKSDSFCIISAVRQIYSTSAFLTNPLPSK